MPARGRLARQVGADEPSCPCQKAIHFLLKLLLGGGNKLPSKILRNELNFRPAPEANIALIIMAKNVNGPRRRPTHREQQDLDLEIGFLEGLVRRNPTYVEALQILGDNYTRRGRYTEGLKVDERLSRLRPDIRSSITTSA